MQDSIRCFVSMPYCFASYIIDIPISLTIKTMMQWMKQTYPSAIEAVYLYDATKKRMLDSDLTFEKANVKSGSYLYLI